MKKITFFLCALLISAMSFAETASLSFQDAANRTSSTTTKQVWEQNGLTYIYEKGTYQNNLAEYAPIRCYQNTKATIECSDGNISSIVFNVTESKYVTPMKNSLNGLGTIQDSGNNVTLTLTTPGMSVTIAKFTTQVRLNNITVTYDKVVSAEPKISCSKAVSFGAVTAKSNSTKQLVVEGENLTEAISAKLQNGTAFTVAGDLTTTGGTLTLAVTAIEEGEYADKLTLASGETSVEIDVTATVVICQGEGTKEKPYTVADLAKLANPTTKAWVVGYIVGEIVENKLSTSNFSNGTNIALADTDVETKKYAPIQLPAGDIRTALNLINNPSNLHMQVAVYGTLESYFSNPGVKNVSDYVILTAPVINHTIIVSANPAEAGTVTGGSTYEHGAEANLTATANEGYEFVSWTEGEEVVSTNAEYTFEVLADRNLVANFKAVEPTTITYELNGGEFPAVVVPTNEELAMAFKQEYAEYFAIEGLTDTDMNREVGNFIYVTNSKGGDAVKFITENANWKWLADYIISVAAAIPEGTNVGYYWRANIDAFFHCKNAVAVGGVNSADFSEAGKPENWGAAYEAAHEVVLPTEPVAEDYVLPTPVKEGYTFVGWYDNAEGTGKAYTVIPAGWSGTLYAIWKQSPTTALDNIAIEGKVVKTIINGQLIIINNGVQYNALGQVIR